MDSRAGRRPYVYFRLSARAERRAEYMVPYTMSNRQRDKSAMGQGSGSSIMTSNNDNKQTNVARTTAKPFGADEALGRDTRVSRGTSVPPPRVVAYKKPAARETINEKRTTMGARKSTERICSAVGRAGGEQKKDCLKVRGDGKSNNDGTEQV